MRCITTCSLKTQGLCHFQRKVSRGQGFRIQSDKSSQQRALPESSDATLPGKMLRCLPARNKRYKIKLHRKKRINFKANVICARSLHRIKDTLVDSNEIMFQCTFKIHGRGDLKDMTAAAEIERGENSKYKSNYVVVKCPFKLIYREVLNNDSKHDFHYRLVRHEMNHIHPVDFWGNNVFICCKLKNEFWKKKQ